MAEKRNNNFWYWIIGTLIVLGLIWWWASASIGEPEEGLDDATPEEVGVEDDESAYLKNMPDPSTGVVFLSDYPKG